MAKNVKILRIKQVLTFPPWNKITKLGSRAIPSFPGFRTTNKLWNFLVGENGFSFRLRTRRTPVHLHLVKDNDINGSDRCKLSDFSKSRIWTLLFVEFIAEVRLRSGSKSCLVCTRTASIHCSLCAAVLCSQRCLRINSQYDTAIVIAFALHPQVRAPVWSVLHDDSSRGSLTS